MRADHTHLSDLTRPIRRDRQLVTGRRHRWVIALVSVGILGALLAALFILPVQAWQRQEDEETNMQVELTVLKDAILKLDAEVKHLGTTEGSKEAAREELGVIAPGEERISILPSDPAPLPLPTGWPYDTVVQIVAVRSAPPLPEPEPIIGATISP